MVSTRSSSRAASAVPEALLIPATPSTTRRTRRAAATPAPAKSSGSSSSSKRAPVVAAAAWQHKPSTKTLLWLAVSLPLVAWDTGYVLLRPLSMEGGSLHWPLWVPYRLYGETDLVYGWKAFDSKNGFTGAQGFMNLVETLLYLLYLGIWFRGSDRSLDAKARRTISGRPAAWAVLVGFSAAVMTFSKTVLYWACEYYSGFDNIGHNSARDLFVLWVIPNGAWLVLPAYMIYVFGNEILDGLAPPERPKSK